jgi:hypothetical protein
MIDKPPVPWSTTRLLWNFLSGLLDEARARIGELEAENAELRKRRATP